MLSAMWRLRVEIFLSLAVFVVLASSEPGCLEIQSQTVKFVQFSTNVKRADTAITLALNCCPNDKCCSPGVFDSGYVFDSSGKCLSKGMISKIGNALTCSDNTNQNLPPQQRRATVTGVKNGYQLRCLFSNEQDETFDESVSVNIKVLPQLMSLTHEIVEQGERQERGVMLTCRAALGTYDSESVELSFSNQTLSETQPLIGTTLSSDKVTRELTGKEKEISDYLKKELNLSAPSETVLKHFIPDRLVFWRNLTVGCQVKLAARESRQDLMDFDTLDHSKKFHVLSEHNLETLPKVELTFDVVSKRLRCNAFSFPRATSIKWSYATARGQNFTDIPVTNVSAAEVVANDWYLSWYNGPYEPKSFYRCVVQNSVGSSAGELELTSTVSVTAAAETTSTADPHVTGGDRIWDARGGPPAPIDAQFPFYWVIVVVGILIIFAVAIAVILHLRKRAGAEYKSGKKSDAIDDEEQQRLQEGPTKSGYPDGAGGGNEMAEATTVKGSNAPRTDGPNKSTDVL